MNLEEARNNIGAEVELDESTNPYTFIDDGEILKAEFSIIKGLMKIFSCRNDGNVVVVSGNGVVKEWYLPKHLKLKPQNYKISLISSGDAIEAQRLFFSIGYKFRGFGISPSSRMKNIFAEGKSKLLSNEEFKFNDLDAKQITLQELRDIVAKKKGIKYIGVDLAGGEDKTVQVTGTFQNFEPRKEMTWEDALRAVADGKEVEVKNISWFNIKDLKLENVKRGTAFRVVPKRITLNGEYTKEELLQKIGEME